MYAGCSTPGEAWAAPERGGRICTLLAAPRGGFHPPHRRAPRTLPVTEKQWTQSQVRNWPFTGPGSGPGSRTEKPRVITPISSRFQAAGPFF